ncbi:MAG: hypothetical protein Athens071416_644 [Parcubacteria group bacterium Athens0714_16]|nr:MAG: hypothetical protein Athens071416_644 [Parcubacteria group bacterium Athens0714_16]
MFEKPLQTIESHEKPHPEFLKVFRFRHGSTEYTELNPDITTDEFDLTEKGKDEVTAGANSIMKTLDKEKDVIVFVSSPRVRAKGSMKIVRDIFENNGFTIWKSRDDSRLIKKELRSGDDFNDEGNPIEKDHPDFRSSREKTMNALKDLTENKGADLSDITDISIAWANAKDRVGNLENFDEAGERTKKLIDLAFKVAHTTQKKTEKQIVIISFEHAETIDPITSAISEGELSLKKGNSINKGEPLEMDISTTDYSLKVSFPMRDDKKMTKLAYNKENKIFEKYEN